MRRLLGLIGALALVTGGADAATLTSGLRGTVVEYGGGACSEGTDCRSPASGATLTFSHSGRARVRSTTHGDGSYRVRLAPGVYTVRVVDSGPRTKVQPSLVSVPQGRVKLINFAVVTFAIP